MFPGIIVVLTGILALIWQISTREKDHTAIAVLSVLGLVAAGVVLFLQFPDGNYDTGAGMFYADSFSRIMQMLVIGGTALTVLFSESYLRHKQIHFAEFYPLVLWSAFGAMLMASTKSLLVMFVGLEVLSVSLYVMAGLSRSEEKSEESAMKYFLLGAFASAFLLYGIALIYGAVGSLNLQYVSNAWLSGNSSTHTLLLFGLGMALVGLSFKASFVPFHQWTPDVYQGAPTNVAAFMATVSKVGAFAPLYRVLDGCAIFSSSWIPALAIVAALTMTIGNVIALAQKDVKRVLGYSSVSHAGYILVAIIAHFKNPAQVGLSTLTFYLFSYTLMTIGAFAVVSLTARDGHEATRFEDLNGLYKRSPLAAVAMVIFMASLIGIPPAAGFYGKLQIFNDALTAQLGWLAIFLAINSVFSLGYYLRLGYSAFVSDDENAEPARLSPSVAVACVLCAVGVLGGSLAVPFFAALR